MAQSKDFDNFEDEDFDSLIEAEEPEEAPSFEEIEEPKKKPVPPIAPNVPKRVAPVPVKKVVAPAPVEEPEVVFEKPQQRRQTKQQLQQPRYVAYKAERRYGLIDNVTGQPVMESADIETMTLMVLSDILNRLDKIESSI